MEIILIYFNDCFCIYVAAFTVWQRFFFDANCFHNNCSMRINEYWLISVSAENAAFGLVLVFFSDFFPHPFFLCQQSSKVK